MPTHTDFLNVTDAYLKFFKDMCLWTWQWCCFAQPSLMSSFLAAKSWCECVPTKVCQWSTTMWGDGSQTEWVSLDISCQSCLKEKTILPLSLLIYDNSLFVTARAMQPYERVGHWVSEQETNSQDWSDSHYSILTGCCPFRITPRRRSLCCQWLFCWV